MHPRPQPDIVYSGTRTEHLPTSNTFGWMDIQRQRLSLIHISRDGNLYGIILGSIAGAMSYDPDVVKEAGVEIYDARCV